MGYLDQIGIAEQANFDTEAVVSRFYQWNSDSLKPNQGNIQTEVRGSMFYLAELDRDYPNGGEGDIELDFTNTGMGLWLKHIFGDDGSGAVQVGITDEYVQTFVLDTAGKRGLALTVQKGVEDVAGDVQPFTFVGVKVLRATFTQDLDGNLKLSMGVYVKEVNDATDLELASYPTQPIPLSFLDATLELDGGDVCARNVNITIEWPMNVDRRCLGNVRKEPIPNGKVNVTGTMDLEFENRDQYDAWRAGSLSPLTVTWAYGEIGSTGNPYQLILTLANIKRRGDMPAASGNEIATQAVAFQALFDGTNPLIEASYHSSDTAA